MDPTEHNEAMIEKHTLPFPLLGDPKGDHAKRCGLWNDKECVAVPAIVIVDRGGIARYLHAGPDFADRPGDKEVFDALDGLSEADTGGNSAGESVKIRASPEEAADSTHRPDKSAMPLEQLIPYCRGVFFTTVALKRRFGEIRDRDAFEEVNRYQQMVKEYRGKLQENVEQDS